MSEIENAWENMVSNQLKAKGIKDKKVIESFLNVNRKNFVREGDKNMAYEDTPLLIDAGQTISQPYIVALMSEFLEPKENDVVLEIGTGSGYQAAILAKIVKKVVSFEIIPELCRFAKENLKKEGIENVEIHCSDGSEIIGDYIFDKIIVTAATPKILQTWIDSLKEGGIMIVPEGRSDFQILRKYVKKNEKLEKTNNEIPVRFVPLKGKGGFK